MISKWNRYLVTSLFGLALITAGCAARTGPIEGQARVEGDTSSARTESQTDQSKKKSSGEASGSTSGSGSASGSASGSGSGSATGKSGY
jgi:hypothetical protein